MPTQRQRIKKLEQEVHKRRMGERKLFAEVRNLNDMVELQGKMLAELKREVRNGQKDS